MSKVRINDLARELEVKPRAILDILPQLGVDGIKTHSSSLELDEAEKVRARFAQDAKPAAHAGAAAGRHAAQTIVPKIDLSHISKPGDVMKAILAKKKEEEEEARQARLPAKPAAAPAAKPAAPAPPPGCRTSAPRCSSRNSGGRSSRPAKDRSAAALCAAHYRRPSPSCACHRFASSRRRRGSQGSRRGHSYCATGGRGRPASGCSGG